MINDECYCGKCQGYEEDEIENDCNCEYPHSSDYDPYNYEQCTCEDGCYHFPFGKEE